MLGTILLGVFAVESVGGTAGLIDGNAGFLMKQIIAVAISAVYAFVFTYLMLLIINVITKVKVTEVMEDEGIDSAIHGEVAYDQGVL